VLMERVYQGDTALEQMRETFKSLDTDQSGKVTLNQYLNYMADNRDFEQNVLNAETTHIN